MSKFAPSPIIYHTEAAWLEARRAGLGATDAAAAMGVSPWKSPFQLWSEKVGLVEDADLSANEAVAWGTRLQPIIGDAYHDATGRGVLHEPRFSIRRHSEIPWMTASLDAIQHDTPTRSPGALEIKTTNAFPGAADWEDEPPLHYQIQLQHQLAVTGMEWGTLCVLIGGQKLRWFDQERNDRFIKTMIDAEAAFWETVQAQKPPAVDGSESTAEVLKRLYPRDSGESVMLPTDAARWDERLCDLKAQLKALEEEKRLLENQLKASIGDATSGILSDGTVYTHKLQTNHYPAKEACEVSFRVLRRRGAK